MHFQFLMTLCLSTFDLSFQQSLYCQVCTLPIFFYLASDQADRQGPWASCKSANGLDYGDKELNNGVWSNIDIMHIVHAYLSLMMFRVIPRSLQIVLYVEEGQPDCRLKMALLQSQELLPVT